MKASIANVTVGCLLIVCGATAFAQSDQPSAKWISDSQYDTVQVYNQAGDLYSAFSSDANLTEAASALKALGDDLRYNFYPEIVAWDSKTALRYYLDQTVSPEAHKALDDLQYQVMFVRPDLASEAKSLQDWLNILFGCVHSDTGNEHDGL